MTEKGEGRSYQYAEMDGNEVTLSSGDSANFDVTFDMDPSRVQNSQWLS